MNGSSHVDSQGSLPSHRHVVDCFTAIQLVFDETYKIIHVDEIPQISNRPYVSSKKVHIHLGSRSDVLKKEFVKSVEDISQFNSFQLDAEFSRNVVKFCRLKASQLMQWEIKDILGEFTEFITAAKVSDRTAAFYIQQTQLIDMLLACKKSTDHQKQLLLNQRKLVLSKTFLGIPKVSKQEDRDSICTFFGITKRQLRQVEVKLSPALSNKDIISAINICSKYRSKYNQKDFDNLDRWKEWKKADTEQYDRLLRRFAISKSNLSSQLDSGTALFLVPTVLQDAIDQLTKIALHGDSEFFGMYIKCLQMWQIQPFTIFRSFLKAATNNFSNANADKVVKALGLAYLSSPMQVTWFGWPLPEKKAAIDIGLKIFSLCKEQLKPHFANPLGDIQALTTSLVFLQRLHLSRTKDVVEFYKKNMQEGLTGRLVSRLESLKLTEQNNKDASKSSRRGEDDLNFDMILKLLSSAVSDLDVLYNWKVKNKDLDKTFEVCSTAEKIIEAPTLNYVQLFIESFLGADHGKSTLQTKKGRQDFAALVGLLGNLKRKAALKFDFENALYHAFSKIVSFWVKEMLGKVKDAITNDMNLKRLDGCSYSSSVQNVMGICNAYLKLLESFDWDDKVQVALLFTKLYKGIFESLLLYSNDMLTRFNHKLLTARGTMDFRGEYCTCLNNVTKIIEYFSEFDTQTLTEYSEVLSANIKPKSASRMRKFVSVRVLNAENVENGKGEPVSLSVEIEGLIRGVTRTVYTDYNPTWNENFEDFVSGTGDHHMAFLRITLNDASCGNVYKSLVYPININDMSKMPLEEKISLQPKSGVLNILVNVDIERNDPVYYSSKVLSEIVNGRDRAIKLLVDKFSNQVKEIFTREYLQQSLELAPVKKHSNFQVLKDQKVDTYINEMQLHTISELYDNLETELFDEVMLQLWFKVLNSAENLLLPRLSFLFHGIVTKLDKRSSLTNFSFISRYHKTSSHDIQRVVEWCWKFREMLNNPDKILQDPLEKPFQRFLRIQQLYGMKSRDLKDSIYQVTTYLNGVTPSKYSKINFDSLSFTKAKEDRTLILRVLMSKGETQFVKNTIEMAERYERALKAEREVIVMGI